MKTIKLAEAPNYDISEDGTITNRLTKLPVTASKGTARLTVNGERKAFKVDVLKERYFPTAKAKTTDAAKPKTEDKPKAADKTADKPKADEKGKDKSADKGKEKKADKTADKPKEKKKAKSTLSNHKVLDKKFFDKVRADYDKDPAKFDIMKYAKKHDVSYGRIWSVIKLHKAKLAEPKKAEKKADKPVATATDKTADKKSDKKAEKKADKKANKDAKK